MIHKLTLVASLALVAYVASEPAVNRKSDPISIAVNTDNGGDDVKVSDIAPWASYAPWTGYGNWGGYGPWTGYGAWGGYAPWANYGALPYFGTGLNKGLVGYYPGGPLLNSGLPDPRSYTRFNPNDIKISSVDKTDVDVNVGQNRRF